MKTLTHGTLSGYTYHKCRCTDCKAAMAAYDAAPARKLARAAYSATSASKVYQAAYRVSPKGKASQIKCGIKRRCDPEYRVARAVYSSAYRAIPTNKAVAVAYSTIYRASPKGKAVQNKANAKYRATSKGGLVQRAHSALRTSIEAGRTTRQSCLYCGNPKSQGHHEDYAKPLQVEWLCKKHHEQFHKWRD